MSYGPLGNKIFGYDLPNTNTPYTWYIKQGPFLVILGLDFFSSKKDSSRGNFYRGIDCAYSRSVKMASWPWFREGGRYIEEKNEKLRVLMDNHRFWGNLWWEIECAHSRVMEMLSWPWFRDAERCTISLYNIKLIPSRTIKVSICIFKGSVTFIA